MNKDTVKQHLVEKMDEIVRSLREQLEKNEGCTLCVIASSAIMGYETLKATVTGNDTTKELMEKFQAGVDDFQTALKDGDRKISSGILQRLEKLVAELKENTDPQQPEKDRPLP